MCTICGDTGYKPAVRYGLGSGTSADTTIWADHAVMEPCECNRGRWPHYTQPIYIPIPPQEPDAHE